ncbi:hypothetical protein R3P38DRAFT_3210794 [Favolaschia claudopus]|uniref:Uncharacterized protein n=1 Tax=Favolaschia claudopus TaxID=2862362 RepID=A0AAW0AGL4_9AGAR
MANCDDQSNSQRVRHTWFMSPERANAAHPTYRPRQDDLWPLALVLFTMSSCSRPWIAAPPPTTATPPSFLTRK